MRQSDDNHLVVQRLTKWSEGGYDGCKLFEHSVCQSFVCQFLCRSVPASAPFRPDSLSCINFSVTLENISFKSHSSQLLTRKILESSPPPVANRHIM